MTDTNRRPNLFVPILALMVGIFAFMAWVIAQNGSPDVSIPASAAEHEANVMLSLEHAAKRHGPIVYTVNDYCNKGGTNIQAQLSKEFPDGKRNAFVCFFPEDQQWWVVIRHDSDDHVVTIFPRSNAKSLQDLITYLTNGGYQ